MVQETLLAADRVSFETTLGSAAISVQYLASKMTHRQNIESYNMAPSIPTYRPVLTPARVAWVVAAVAVAGNLYLVLGDALASASGVQVSSSASSCVEAVRGRYPGEPLAQIDTQTWVTR